ncbi:hypothetical protein AB205_0153090, partial [Aquarana catesbeiana]
ISPEFVCVRLLLQIPGQCPVIVYEKYTSPYTQQPLSTRRRERAFGACAEHLGSDPRRSMYLSAAVRSMLTGLILCSLRVAATQQLLYPPSRIAVVGAGIGGTSAAYFLRQKFGKDVHIDVFEKGDVGGRLATIEMEGNQYEAGGTVIHPLNLHMKAFVKDLGLNPRKPSGDLLGIYNGDEFVFQESEWFLINIIKMLWNYGLNFLRMYMWVEDILDKFM